MTPEASANGRKYVSCSIYTVNGWHAILKKEWRTPSGGIVVKANTLTESFNLAAEIARPATEEEKEKYGEERKWTDINIH